MSESFTWGRRCQCPCECMKPATIKIKLYEAPPGWRQVLIGWLTPSSFVCVDCVHHVRDRFLSDK
jgi:hypothetical protein